MFFTFVYLILLLLLLKFLTLVKLEDLGPRHGLHDLLFAVAAALEREDGLRGPPAVLLVQQLGVRRPGSGALHLLQHSLKEHTKNQFRIQ